MRVLGALLLCVFSAAVLAQPAAPPFDPFKGSAALGYLSTSGNTDSTNGNASFKVTWDLMGPWKHDWNAFAINARTAGVTTAEAYSAGYKGQRDVSATTYLFASGDWRQDRFSGYEKQVTEAMGYGRRLVDTARHTLSLEGGAGAKQSDLIDGRELDEVIVRGGFDYLLRITESSELSQKILIEQGEDNRYSESTTAVKARIVGNLAIVLSYVIKNNSDVPAGIQETDRFTAISLEYGF